MDHGVIQAIYHYPVKGLSAQPLAPVALKAGAAIGCDRAFALEAGTGKFDPAVPKHMPKINFLMLMRDERLASLDSHFDAETTTLTLSRDGATLVSASLATPEGRAAVERCIADDLGETLRGRPRLVAAPGHSFSDVPMKCLHIINLASVRALEAELGRPLDPMRFRANIIIDGLEPWGEFAWVNRTIAISGARADVLLRTERCAATNVDPGTAMRSGDLPGDLMRAYGHADFGIYAKVTDEGEADIGDVVALAA
ncbi:MAG: MOSC domain-containing protein [Pseudomonadota bacterium]